jgi:hypothetical protein
MSCLASARGGLYNVTSPTLGDAGTPDLPLAILLPSSVALKGGRVSIEPVENTCHAGTSKPTVRYPPTRKRPMLTRYPIWQR